MVTIRFSCQLFHVFFFVVSDLWDFYWVCPLALLQIAALISLGFLGCWSPYGLVSLWSIFQDSSTIPAAVSLLPCMFAKSSTVYNPMVYYIFSQSFKREVKKLCCRCVGSRSCHVSSINVNSIYMVNSDIRPKAAAQTSSHVISQSQAVIMDWKLFFFKDNLERKDSSSNIFVLLKRGKRSGLILCYLTNIIIILIRETEESWLQPL